ncbi:MAG: hypothetical protein ETSY2_35435 [Candidatus Entotheonella gemina]|uniref:PA domain-containing protein n=2 Tax=Candidatus Entotheonella TaxID=93171 RepID=W4LWL7_9BACT|nr:MAG: hypothetical protein ETSY2_35435 [Candidatus Entotheonella gemina]
MALAVAGFAPSPQSLFETIDVREWHHDPSQAMIEHDQQVENTVSMARGKSQTGTGIENFTLLGRGVRRLPNATTDVWALRDHAYIGTFNAPCGDGTGDNGSGVRIFDVSDPAQPVEIGPIPSVLGSRTNDVKVAELRSGDVLGYSNESCGGGPGGIELWDVTDPSTPSHLASIRVGELNPIVNTLVGGATADVGVHNLWLFTQGDRDFVALYAESVFHNFRIFDITTPAAPVPVSAWGAEEVFDPGVGDLNFDAPDGIERVQAAFNWLLSGMGDLAFRLLHDITINASGDRAYLSYWDAGLILLDISDPSTPQLLSVADPAAGPGGEGNSHAAWPSADGTVVVETTEDFDFGQLAITVDSGPLAGRQFGGIEDIGGAPPPRFAEMGPVQGELVFVGELCRGAPVENASAFDPGDIAVIRGSFCTFSEQLLIAQELGAAAAIIADILVGRQGIPSWTAPVPAITIPALMISTADGVTLMENPTGNIATIDPNVYTNLSPWGFVRIWDYSDETNPQLASTFLTDHARNESGPPDPRGTYSVHNVIVEGNIAFLSHYSDGVIALDISDPGNPVEIARYNPADAAFEEQNGGIQNVWGIYKIEGDERIFASDRNGGLYILQLLGNSSAKVSKAPRR